MQKQTPALFVKDWPKIQKTKKPKKVISGAELQYLVDINRDALTDLQKEIDNGKELASFYWDRATPNDPATEKYFIAFSNVQRDLRKMKHHYKQLSKVQALLKGMR